MTRSTATSINPPQSLLHRLLAGRRQALIASTLVAAFAASSASTAQAAEVYRWVDDNGVVNYSQVRPENVRNVEQVRTLSGSRRTAPVAASAASQPAQPGLGRGQGAGLSPAQQNLKEELEIEERQQLAELDRIRADNCQRNRDLLRQLTSFARMRVKGDDGEYRILGEDERRTRIDEVQGRVVEFCG